MTEYTTRNLTVEESAELVRRMHLALGKSTLVDVALRVIAEQGLGIFAADEVVHGENYISDEGVNKMHPRQAAELIQVPAEDRRVVIARAWFLGNVRGGNMSGNIGTARREYERLGAEGLAAATREENAHMMGWK